MQNALIRKKLEEQRENFRKRQEAAAQQSTGTPISNAAGAMSSNTNIGPQSVLTTTIAPSASKLSIGNDAPISQSGPINPPPHSSPVKHTASPTPLAFTPTSVLRKMTAEKESESNNMNASMTGSNQLGAATSSNSGNTTNNPGNVLLNSIANTGNKPINAPHSGAGGPRDANVTVQSAALQREQQRLLNQQAVQAQAQLNANMANMQMKMNAPPTNGPPMSQQQMSRNNPPGPTGGVNHLAWMNQMQQQQQQQAMKPQGRPIVKGNQASGSGQPNHPNQMQMPPFNSHQMPGSSGGSNPLMGGPNAAAASAALEYNLHLQRQKAQQQQQQQQHLMNQVNPNSSIGGAGANGGGMSHMTAQQIQQLLQHRQAQQAQQAQRLQNDLRYRQMMQQQQHHGGSGMNDGPLGGGKALLS